ncbi:MAG: tandem-95 repeat protein [Opitutaceae bacterium]|nr:tandem-95 repeat protein [Opitutaceae bacterium]
MVPVNDCPIPIPVSVVVLPRTTPAPVLLVATDGDGDSLTFTIVTGPAHGALPLGTSTSTSASYTYTPTADFHGSDSFTFAVSDGACTTDPITVPITVEPVNDTPTARPQALETPEDTPLPVVLDGTDPEPLCSVSKFSTQPQHGTLTLGASASSYLYTPAPEWSGADGFTFVVSDGELTSASAAVSIVVTPVNDRPVAIGDTIQVRNNATAPVELRGADIEGDTLTFTVVKQPTYGTLSGSAPQLVYTPDRSYIGADSIEFRVSDGNLDSGVAVIVIDVVAGNTAPTANAQSLETEEDKALPLVLTGTDAERDSLSFIVVDQPRHGSLSGTAPNVVYTPEADYSGPDSFTFKVADATDESVPATVSITVKPLNDPPIVDAGADSAITLPAYATVVGTASDPEGDALTLEWSQVSGPAKVDFETPAALSTRISITTPGSYVFRLTANDGTASASDEVTVVVNSSTLVYRTYTTTADFETGTRTNVYSNLPDQLQLNEIADAGNFLWVAVSSKGTIVKINTRTGKVEGEYWTSPSGQPKNPSRTTVDLNGAVWCTNRDGNSVVQVGSVESGMWIDKNGNGQPDTSTGLGNVRAWTNAGGADTNGGVSTAEDECIINYTRVSSSGTRHICVDRKNDIWVSGTGNRIFDNIDSKTGKILRSEGPVSYGGYGGIIDRNGVIWSTTWSSLLRWDTNKPLTGPAGENWMSCAGSSQYGLALGPDGYVWASGYGAGTVYKYAPAGSLVGQYTQGNSAARQVRPLIGAVMSGSPTRLGSSTVGHLAPRWKMARQRDRRFGSHRSCGRCGREDLVDELRRGNGVSDRSLGRAAWFRWGHSGWRRRITSVYLGRQSLQLLGHDGLDADGSAAHRCLDHGLRQRQSGHALGQYQLACGDLR